MAEDTIEMKRAGLEAERASLLTKLKELENTVQNASGSHRSGHPSRSVLNAEREIQRIVLRLSDIDRDVIELNIEASI